VTGPSVDGAPVTSLVVRAPNWLGDTVMALPALAALRARWPEARIAVVGRWAPLLLGQGVADLLLDHPRARAGRRALARVISTQRPDAVVLLPNSLSAALAARAWRARRVVGYATDARARWLTDALPLPAPRLHQVDEYLALAAALGAAAVTDVPRWRHRARGAPAIADDHAAEVDALLLTALGPAGRGPLVGLHLGATGGSAKRWPAARFAALADRLAAGGVRAILLGSPSDTPDADEIAQLSATPPASLVGRDRPALLPELLRRLDCLVSGDTGVAHLAAAVGAATVTLFGPTEPAMTAPRGPAARVLAPGAPCAPCFLARCPIDHPCMTGIDPEVVCRAVAEALAAGAGTPAPPARPGAEARR
jgi:heptosyltransferase-2